MSDDDHSPDSASPPPEDAPRRNRDWESDEGEPFHDPDWREGSFHLTPINSRDRMAARNGVVVGVQRLPAARSAGSGLLLHAPSINGVEGIEREQAPEVKGPSSAAESFFTTIMTDLKAAGRKEVTADALLAAVDVDYEAIAKQKFKFKIQLLNLFITAIACELYVDVNVDDSPNSPTWTAIYALAAYFVNVALNGYFSDAPLLKIAFALRDSYSETAVRFPADGPARRKAFRQAVSARVFVRDNIQELLSWLLASTATVLYIDFIEGDAQHNIFNILRPISYAFVAVSFTFLHKGGSDEILELSQQARAVAAKNIDLVTYAVSCGKYKKTACQQRVVQEELAQIKSAMIAMFKQAGRVIAGKYDQMVHSGINGEDCKASAMVAHGLITGGQAQVPSIEALAQAAVQLISVSEDYAAPRSILKEHLKEELSQQAVLLCIGLVNAMALLSFYELSWSKESHGIARMVPAAVIAANIGLASLMCRGWVPNIISGLLSFKISAPFWQRASGWKRVGYFLGFAALETIVYQTTSTTKILSDRFNISEDINDKTLATVWWIGMIAGTNIFNFYAFVKILFKYFNDKTYQALEIDSETDPKYSVIKLFDCLAQRMMALDPSEAPDVLKMMRGQAEQLNLAADFNKAFTRFFPAYASADDQDAAEQKDTIKQVLEIFTAPPAARGGLAAERAQAPLLAADQERDEDELQAEEEGEVKDEKASTAEIYQRITAAKTTGGITSQLKDMGKDLLIEGAALGGWYLATYLLPDDEMQSFYWQLTAKSLASSVAGNVTKWVLNCKLPGRSVTVAATDIVGNTAAAVQVGLFTDIFTRGLLNSSAGGAQAAATIASEVVSGIVAIARKDF